MKLSLSPGTVLGLPVYADPDRARGLARHVQLAYISAITGTDGDVPQSGPDAAAEPTLN